MSQSSEPFDPYYQWLGIPPDEQPPNHYRLLGIQLFEENREVITHAADRQMVHLRSFQNGPRAAQSQKLLNEVAAAKVCLLCPDRKAAYDAEFGSAGPGVPMAAPPIATQPPVESSVGITFGGTPGMLTAAPSYRAARISRPRRRSGLLPWLLVLIVAVIGCLALWAWWSDQHRNERLVLVWPAAEREHATLEVDGRPIDLVHDAVARGVEQLELALEPGYHELRITRPGFEPILESIEVAGGVPTQLEISMVAMTPADRGERTMEHAAPAIGRVILRWPIAMRTGAGLTIDDRAVDLTRRAFVDNPDTVEVPIKAGSHRLQVVLADGETVERSFAVESGGLWELIVVTTPVRIVLAWPAADREGANLEIDGRPRDATADSVAADPEKVAFEVQPGQHTVRISRTGFEDFRTQLADLQAEQTITVKWEKAAHPRPAPAELQKLREDFRKSYEKFEQYEKWAAEKDAGKQTELLKFLLARLELEAGKFAAQSDQQWAACDEMLNLALTGHQFVLAQNLLTGNVGRDLFSDSERQTWEERIWEAALKSVQVEDLADYLKLRKTAGRVPTEAEQAVIVQRLSEAAEAGADCAEIDARVQELQDENVLPKLAAMQARVAVYRKAADREFVHPAPALDLCERILRTVPLVFESGLDDAAHQVDVLVDTVSGMLRRKALKEARMVDELRLRMFRIDEGIKIVRDWASQFSRVQAARKSIAQGQAAAADHKLVGFWLLQLGQFAEALPYLRNTEDEALSRIGQPIPETAKGLADLANEVEQESRKSKYSRRQEESLRALVRYLRQSALDKKDNSLQPAQRMELEKKLSAVEAERSELDDRRFPKEKWCSLAELAAVDELRDCIDHTGHGSWSLLEDGSIATTGKGAWRKLEARNTQARRKLEAQNT